MANRNKIKVRRAAYRKPSPTANRRAVSSTREVRESKSVKSYPGKAGFRFRVSAISKPDTCPSVSFHDRVLAHDGDPHQLPLIVEPELPGPRVGLQFQPIQFLHPALQAHLFPANGLRAQRCRRLLVRIQGPELGTLL